MLARLLQLTTLSLLGVAAAWLAYWWDSSVTVAAGGAVALLTGHGAFLALEMLFVHHVHGDDPAPRATPRQLFKAWVSELFTAPLVFCWRQPFRSHAQPDHLPVDSRGRRGVLLVHGFVCNRGLWNPWMAAMRKRGIPFVAVNLEPVFGEIDRYDGIVQAGWQRLIDATGVAPVVVGHSMGGLVIRHWLRTQTPEPPPHWVVTIGSPHHGTWLGRFARTANARQMRQACDWILKLGRDEQATSYAKFTCFYSHCDNVVFPASTATLKGADNRHVVGQSHVHLAYHPAVLTEVLHLVQQPASAVVEKRPQVDGDCSTPRRI